MGIKLKNSFFFILNLLFFFNSYALLSSEKDLLLQAYDLGLQNTPAVGFRYSEADLKADARFAATQNSSDQALVAYKFAVEEMQKTYRHMRNLKVLHPNGVFAASYEFFKSIPGSYVSVPVPNQKIYDLYTKFNQLKFKKHTLNMAIRVEPNYAQFPWDLNSFAYSLIILDHQLAEWFKTKSLDDLKSSLTRVSEKAPFVLLTIPERAGRPVTQDLKKMMRDPRLFYPWDAMVDVKKVPGTDRSFLVIKKGTRVQGKMYEGHLTIYDGDSSAGTWIGKDNVVKEYWVNSHPGEYGRTIYKNTLEFIKRAEESGFDFIPQISVKSEEYDRNSLVMANLGQNLFTITKNRSSEDIRSIVRQVLQIMTELEFYRLTNGDLKAPNFVVDHIGKVRLIDFDLSKFDQGPSLESFLCVCWGMVYPDGLEDLTYWHPGFLFTTKADQYGPVLSDYVRPILEGKVKSFEELLKVVDPQSSYDKGETPESKYAHLLETLDKHMVLWRGIKIAHPYPKAYSSDSFFVPYLGHTIYFPATDAPQESQSKNVRVAPDIDNFYKDIFYRQFDLCLIDQLGERWMRGHSDDWIISKLYALMELIPFVAIFPPDNLMSKRMHRLFSRFGQQLENSKVYKLKVINTGPQVHQKIYLIMHTGMVIKGQTFEGEIYAYPSGASHMTWLGESVVMKEYIFRDKKGQFYDGEYFRTLDFYKKCESCRLDVLPELVTYDSLSDKGFIVTKRKKSNLYDILKTESEQTVHSIMGQLIDALKDFEFNNFTPNDLHAGNIVIDENKRPYFIDYDIALFDRPPTLMGFLNILMSIERTFIANEDIRANNVTVFPLDAYAPVLRRYAEPIITGKVKNFAELKKYLYSNN